MNRRLALEFKQLASKPTDGLVAGPSSSDNLLDWDAVIVGPVGTPYEHGFFQAKLVFPVEYPYKPPVMRFTTPIFHPNVYSIGERKGEVCISILHQGEDQTGYEHAAERWSPVQSVEKILLSVISMLAEPNAESPANVEAAKMMREAPDQFQAIVRANVRDSLGFRHTTFVDDMPPEGSES